MTPSSNAVTVNKPARGGDESDTKSSASSLSNSAHPGTQVLQMPAPFGLHDDIILEKRVPAEPIYTLPKDDDEELPPPRTHTLIPKISDPLKTQIPKPDGDPFEHLLKPMLEKDTIQCNAWKDEVQNILIFAGLFSAVVTAFIIESYQRLQPDPNDTIVGLLAHIADRLDKPTANATAAVSSILVNTDSSPSRPDIVINIFWFISLVLSLTVALIGIITLQWLREHQRYDNKQKPQERLAIFNARRHSLERWYVPQIFAGLPLLLQGALVLFFVGLAEFLFAIRRAVAIPVTSTICVPFIFLTVTTLLPVLHVCVLQEPFKLSINNQVPSPCPYKSPQSLIARRIGTSSKIAFKYFATIIAWPYVCFVKLNCFIQKIFDSSLPLYWTQDIDLKQTLRADYPQKIRNIYRASGDWLSIDQSWLDVRTIYATSLDLNHVDRNRNELWLSGDPRLCREAYDYTRCFHDILSKTHTELDINALYYCTEALCSNMLAEPGPETRHLLPISRGEVTSLVVTFGQFLGQDVPEPKSGSSDLANPLFFESKSSTTSADRMPQNRSPPVPISAGFVRSSKGDRDRAHSIQILQSALMTFCLHGLCKRGSTFQMDAAKDELTCRLIVNQLYISPQRLFSMPDAEARIPARISRYLNVDSSSVFVKELQTHSQVMQHLFLEFAEESAAMALDVNRLVYPGGPNYGGVHFYMSMIVLSQNPHDIADALARLTRLCKESVPTHLIRQRPFLLTVACFYYAAIRDHHYPEPTNEQHNSLLDAIVQSLKAATTTEYTRRFSLNEALTIILDYHRNLQASRYPG